MKMNVKPRKPETRPCKRIFYGSLLFSLVSIFPTGGANAGDASADYLNFSHTKKTETNAVNVYKAFEFQAPQAAIQVRGRVISGEDETGIPGVTIRVRNTSMGTTTDLDGNYTIEVPSRESVLVFSSVGFNTEEVTVGNQTSINVTLMPDIEELSEVVVVGYGTQKRGDIVTAVGSVDGEKIAERGTVGALQAVQGQVAGVDVSAGSGRAGAEFNIQIRGQSTLDPDKARPLFVVDGVIVDNIDFLNPQDIASMDVLKDASSTAIYGSRGSNGVVQITTKQGTGVKDQATISYDGYYGVRQNVRHPDFMDGDEWFRFRQNTFIMQNLASGNYDEASGGLANAPYITARRVANREYTDWPSYFLQTGTQQNHWLTASGTNKGGNLNYVIGGGYQEEKGNLLKDHFNRYNFKASVNHQLNDQWSAGMSINLSLSEIERGSQSAVTNAYRMSPLASPYDSLGNLLYQPAKYGDVNYTSSVNPLVDIENSQDNTRRMYGVGNLYLQYSPLDWLDVRSTFSPSIRHQRRGRFFGSETEARQLQDPSANMRTEERFSYIWDNQLMARKNFGDHTVSADALFSLWYEMNEFGYIDVINLPFESLFYNLGTANNIQEVASGFNKSTIVSYMGRVNYSFKDKYLLQVVNRWDGSSRLAEGHKWASFPSASLGWRVSEESFLQNVGFIYDLKARLSYGFSGNQNIDPYSTQVQATRQTWYDFGQNNLARGLAPSGIVNTALTWERTREVNFGIDYGLIQGRVTGSVDLYDKVSDQLLMDRSLPRETGWESLTDNIGTVQNRGIELSLRTVNIQTNDFSWRTSFNFSRNKNEILELFGGTVTRQIGENPDTGDPYAWIVGEPININYSYDWIGVWQPEEADEARLYGREPGQVKIRDVSGPEGVPDNKIDPDNDFTIIGQAMPSWTGGFSTNFTYKGFDLSASLFTRQGVQVRSPFHQEFTNLNDRGRAKLNVDYYMPENRVTPANITNNYPRPMDPGTEYNIVRVFQDASFVKVQNILLGYNLPASALERINVKSLRVYFNVLNPFVFTDYTGFDPEWASQDLEDTGNASVTYQLGVNLKF